MPISLSHPYYIIPSLKKNTSNLITIHFVQIAPTFSILVELTIICHEKNHFFSPMSKRSWLKIRERSSPPGPAQVSTADVREIVARLANGDISLDSVPRGLHARLLMPLSSAKTEKLFSGKIEAARRIRNIMHNLDFSGSACHQHMRPMRPSLASTLLVDEPENDDEKEVKFRADVESAELFWNNEVAHFNELRAAEMEKLREQQERKISEFIRRPRTRNISRSSIRPLSSAVALREKEKMLINEKNFELAKTFHERAKYVDQIERNEDMERKRKYVSQRVKQMKDQNELERVALERKWDVRWKKLRDEMMNDYKQKDKKLRSLKQTRAKCPPHTINVVNNDHFEISQNNADAEVNGNHNENQELQEFDTHLKLNRKERLTKTMPGGYKLPDLTD